VFNLVLTTLAIALTALVTVGTMVNLNPEMGVRRTTTETVATSYRSFEGAVSAYRISNGGSVPPASNPPVPYSSGTGEPWGSLAPYMSGSRAAGGGAGNLVAVTGLDWTYATDGAGKAYICLSNANGGAVPPAVRQGVSAAVGKTSGAILGRTCGGTASADAASSTDASPYAATFYVQAGG